MVDLNNFRYFVEVVNRGSLSAAAQALQRPVSTISYRLRLLETELGLTLLVRTPRHVTLTAGGEAVYAHAVTMLQSAAEAEMAARNRSNTPVGVVRYSVGVAVSQFAMPWIVADFAARYPSVEIVQDVSDESVDIVAYRYDLAIRAHSGTLPDSTLIQRPLADVPWHLFAAPEYLARCGAPGHVADLNERETLFMNRSSAAPAWNLRHADHRQQVAFVSIRPRIQCRCVVTLKRAAEAGLGIVALPAYICRHEVQEGRLKRVLPQWIAEDSRITALMPVRRGVSAAARAFVDNLANSLPAAVAA